MATPVRNIALFDETGKMKFERLVQIADAVQIQMNRDVKPQWNVGAIVSAYRTKAEIPAGFWTCSVVFEISEGKNLNGVHWHDENGIPYAKVRYTNWQTLDFFENNLTKVISEEIIEKCIDPMGDNTIKGNDPENPANQEVEFLIELGDATQAMQFGYYINDVFVTNFIYPSWFWATAVPYTKYDHLGQFSQPKELGEGGYQIFKRAGQWYQAWKIGGINYFIKQGESVPSGAVSDSAKKMAMWLIGGLYLILALVYVIPWLVRKLTKNKN